MSDLKRCPFCNDLAEFDFAHKTFTYTNKYGEARYTGFYYTVKCTNEICGCHIGIYEEPEMAIKAWNRRVSEMSGTEGRVNKMDDYISRHGVSAWLDNMGHPKLADIVMDKQRFPSVQPERTWISCDTPPEHHKDVIVRGIEAIGNVTVHNIMQWDVDRWRPENYAPSIIWLEWCEI